MLNYILRAICSIETAFCKTKLDTAEGIREAVVLLDNQASRNGRVTQRKEKTCQKID